MSGKLKTIESVFESKNIIDHLLVIDLSIAPKRISDFISVVQPKINQFILLGGKVVYFENCSISSKNRRRQLKAADSIRTEAHRSYIHIFSFSEDISLKTKAIQKYKYLNSIQNNCYFFPYASPSEIAELVSQNENRYQEKVQLSSPEIYSQTSGVPYLVKSFFHGHNQLGDSIRHYISQFSRAQINELKHLTPTTIKSYRQLGLLTDNGDFISPSIAKEISESKACSKFVIDPVKKLISVDGQSVVTDLNSYEKEILFKLKQDNKISREEIAVYCYGSKKASNYSDYAIDKIISRLRNTLTNLGADPSVIKTNRGFGYSLHNHG
ncbi:MAG: winged helix-turn-helix domain-containing protein [Microgenomates group bacterium]